MSSTATAAVDGPPSAPITVHLPSHSHSLSISSLAPNATVADLKRAITEQCPGRPNVDGQRIIMQGRLLKDDEILPATEPRVVHLAVHPGAWTSTPPSSPRRSDAALPAEPALPESTVPLPTTTTGGPPQSTEPPLPLTLQLASLPSEFVTHVHANALRILSGQPALRWPGPSEVSHARRVARTVIKYAGLGWPPILEEDLPTEVEPEKGAQYTSVVIDGLPYLALASPDMEPTPAQAKALQILTYTFPLLPLMKHLPRPAPLATRTRVAQQLAQNQVNNGNAGGGGQVIRRFGINVRLRRGVQVAQAAAPGARGDGQGIDFDDEDPQAYFPPVPEFRFQFQLHIPPSRVLLQLLFTLSRAALLLYFFAPARKPLWIACIVGWIGWEIFVVLRHAGREGNANAERNNGQRDGGGGRIQHAAEAVAGAAAAPVNGGPPPAPGANNGQDANGGAGGVAAPPAPGLGGPNPAAQLAPNPNANELAQFVNRIANMNLHSESDALNLAVQTPPTPPEAPVPGGPPASPQQHQGPRSDAALEPSLVHRSTTFLALFLTSLAPDVWERRRARLRERERWVHDMFVRGRADNALIPPRTLAPVPPPADGSEDAQAPVTTPSGPEVAARRVEALAGWRRKYVERVISGEAGDDGEM